MPKRKNIQYLSLEPLIGPLLPVIDSIDWVIMGPMTKGAQVVYQPPHEYMTRLLKHVHKLPVFMKDKLDYEPKWQEFPI